MPKLSENKKRAILGILFIAFVGMAYLTFFKKKPHAPMAGQATAPLSAAQTRNPQENLSPLKDLLAQMTLPTKPDIKFKPDIRDMFAPPGPLWRSNPSSAPAITTRLTDAEKASIRDTLLLTGVITHGNRAVAIINGGFFHIHDLVNGYTIVSINEKKVTIDTRQGLIDLGMMKNDLF